MTPTNPQGAGTDAVAQARIALDRLYEATAGGDYDVSAYCAARNALIAAVRAECAAETRPSAKRLNYLANLAFMHPHVRLRVADGEWSLDTGNNTIARGRSCAEVIDRAMSEAP